MVNSNTKIGDVFSVKIDENNKKYFQLIAYDITQLNSDVIRAFEAKYPVETNPDLNEIISSKIEFYAHCITKLGLKMGLWEKCGNITKLGNTDQIIFRDTNDYGSKVGEDPIKTSTNWHVWRIGDVNFTKVGKLEGENKKTFIGIVINPLGIIELLRGNKYPINYPDF